MTQTERPPRPFRILRHHTLPVGTPIVIYYSTRERRDAGAQAWADRDGLDVLTELWDASHDQSYLNRGWACDGARQPATTVTVTGNEEDDGEAPYVYVVNATDEDDAKRQAVTEWRESGDALDPDDEPRKVEAARGMPAFGAYNDLRPISND